MESKRKKSSLESRSRFFQAFIAMSVTISFSQCSSMEQAEFVGKSKYEVSKIDENHDLIVAYGPAPIKISLSEVYLRLSLTPPGKSPRILYLLDPNMMNSSLNPEAQFDATKYDSVGQHATDIDLILRCHRYLLYGFHTEAANVAAELEARRGVSPLTLELRKLIAQISGNVDLANLYRELADATNNSAKANDGLSNVKK